MNLFIDSGVPNSIPFANVKLLLHMDGSNGSTTFTDSSSNAYTVTANGNAQLQTADPKFGSAAGTLDGTGDYLALSTAADWTFLHNGTAWTIECWIKLGATSRIHDLFSTAFNTNDHGVFIQLNTSGQIVVQMYKGVGGTFVLNSVMNLAAITDTTTWHHFAFTFEVLAGTPTGHGYIDGVLAGTSFSANAPSATAAHDPLQIGRFANAASTPALCKIDEVRVANVRAYTAAFTPPASPFPDS